ncbi:hypothetical protein NQ176_g767 [Zarea fungicola]|uniref:Uncharacterized protein n=1 Tax=Zarea fungicola TaxID=93591 RepID=A0ACC1NY28_9HYPO|nr:hypothetical protein NQ176_g767 [Lecanicillium fungicola]
MLFTSALTVSLIAVGLASPVTVIRSEPPPGTVFIPCEEGTKDPICLLVKQPVQDVITEITHPNGTVEIKRNLYSRSELQAIRAANNVVSTEYSAPKEAILDGSVSAASNSSSTKRDQLPPICYTETQRWYDTNNWGYWYQPWHQVGSCFYCDQCTEAIAVSFAVAETWTYGLSGDFDEVIKYTFGFSWGETSTLTDTRTCQWNNVENGCHSIWYQPLMSYHNGEANYQTHRHCYARSPNPATDYYYDHSYTGVNVNQKGNNGVNQGNLGCNSGCGGSDGRQCTNGNFGGSLWPYAN